MKNSYKKVVDDFGEEWDKFNHLDVDVIDQKKIFDSYFKIFPWHIVNKNSSVVKVLGFRNKNKKTVETT